MADLNYSKAAAFAFLEDVKNRFLNQFTDSERIRAIDLSLNDSFKEVLSNRMVRYLVNQNFYNSNPEVDRLKQLKSNVKEVKEIMVDNISKILEREQKVEILVQRTADINTMATTYKKSVISL